MNKQQLINQQQIIVACIKSNNSKAEVMNYLAMVAEELDSTSLPEDCKIAGCLSSTYFRAYIANDGYIRIEGGSQSVVMRGVIKIMQDALNDCDAETIREVGVTWVNDSGLMEMLTPQRQGAIKQMIERINRACAA